MGIYVVISTYLTDETSVKCLKYCVEYALKFYKNILIIDDSPIDGITVTQLRFPSNVKIIRNEFQKSGEITRIWYFWKYCKSGDIGILIHDSTFINHSIPIPDYDYIPLFSFIHKWDNVEHERMLLKQFPQLLALYEQKDKWAGCFGVQYVVKWDFVNAVMNKHLDVFKHLLNTVKSRSLRSCTERVVQVIFLDVSSNTADSIYGTIHNYTARYWNKPWGVSITDIEECKDYLSKVPILKVWVGR